MDFVISFDDGTWDNNNGQDYHITILPALDAGKLAGAVTTSCTGEFLAGAVITVSDGMHVYTGASNDGITLDYNYLIEGISPGTYQVTCMANGYLLQTTTGVEITGGGNITFASFEMQLDETLPPGWEFVLTPASHHISIPIAANPQLEGYPLKIGDFIGVFYLDDNQDARCGGAIQWLDEDNVVTAFGDDAFSGVKDGFDEGEPFTWKIFSQADQHEYYAGVTYDPGFPVSDGKFYNNGLSRLISLDAYQLIPQTFLIPAGWSGISSYIDPITKSVEEIFAPFGEDFIILSSINQVYYPGGSVNTIVNWNYNDGYQVKTLDGFEMEMNGVSVSDSPVELNVGWSLLPVFSPCLVETDAFFGGPGTVNIVKEVAGTSVYWP
nr:hypothetical protein [Bacteroidota bacterium]